MPSLPSTNPLMAHDCIIVGAGIIGSTIYKALVNIGKNPMLLADDRPSVGTNPSGGHLKPSWFGGMLRDDYEPAMNLLDEIWGLKSEEFKIIATGLHTTVYRVDTDQVVKTPHTVARVVSVNTAPAHPEITLADGKVLATPLLIVAAGAWCDELFPDLKIQRKRGVSFRFTGRIQEAFINPWAPYKQVVAHQQNSDEIWIGDGSAILDANWTQNNTLACQERCKKKLGPECELIRSITGLRPYCKTQNKDPCLCERRGRTWIVTGAGKSGTISAGWAARRIINAIS